MVTLRLVPESPPQDNICGCGRKVEEHLTLQGYETCGRCLNEETHNDESPAPDELDDDEGFFDGPEFDEE